MNPFRSAFLVLFGGLLLTLAIRRMRAYRLRERYALAFALLAVPFVCLAFWPDAIGWIATTLNIQYNTLSLLGVTSFLMLAVFDLLSIVRIGKLMPPRRQKAPSLLRFCDWDS